MLFRPQGDVNPFTIDELFKSKEVANSLYKLELPAALSLKP